MRTIALVESMLTRAEQLLGELATEYESSLKVQVVSEKALNLTHEVIEKCSNALDQLMTLSMEQRLPNRFAMVRRGGYFPAADTESSFLSSMGQWKTEDIDSADPVFGKLLRSFQPMTSSENLWLKNLRELARKKHSELVPQKRSEQRQVTVTRGGGSVSWGPSVTFSGNIVVNGARIDPVTQLPVPTPGVTTRVETWVSFSLAETGVNALGFCQDAVRGTRSIVQAFKLELSLT